MVGDKLGASCQNDFGVSTDVIMVVMSVENLGDLPALLIGECQASFVIQWINSKGLSGLWAGDQIVEITIGVASCLVKVSYNSTG